MQLGFYFDQTRCTGCYACIVACKDKNNVEAGLASWRRVTSIEKGEYPELFSAFLSSGCYHCGKPACVEACSFGAISKRDEDGVVVVDRESCTNCQICLDECPYDAPQFAGGPDDVMQKCDFCLDRQAEGKKPVCVSACPMRALDSGPIDELRTKYGDVREAEGFKYAEKLAPSVIFKPKKDTKGLVLQRIEVAPGSRSQLPRND